MGNAAPPPIERLFEAFDYTLNGGLIWKISTSNRVKIGDVAGCSSGSHGYLAVKLDGCLMLVHRIVWAMHYGRWPDSQIDHKNRNRRDNRISNLREASQSEQNCNKSMRASNKTGFKGVSWRPDCNKFVAQIMKDGRQHYLGLFEDKAEAHEAYKRASTTLHGEFRRAE